MITFTGDTHSCFERFNRTCFPEQKQMQKEDSYVMICGDFGGIWMRDEKDKTENYWLDWLEKKNFTTLFVDGNHENFDRLNAFPVEEWNGGKVHRIRDSIFHLMRGQVFTIDGKKIFTFGGARSHDISAGILELDDPMYRQKKKRLDREKAMYRIAHVEWWKEEMPSEEEMQEGVRNLEKNNWTVDYIITHCAPTSIQKQIVKMGYESDELTDYLEMIHEKCDYQYWFCGHYHKNLNVNEKDKVIYEQLIY